jgi:hypothetical protein
VKAKDQYTVDLDWDVRGNALVGAPKYTNSPTTDVAATPGHADTCAPPTLAGPYEQFDATSIAPHPSGVELKGVRRMPSARVPNQYPSTCSPQTVPGKDEDVSEVVAVMSPMMLVMPAGANPNLSVAADRKSFTIKNKGWSYTYTPTIVK